MKKIKIIYNRYSETKFTILIKNLKRPNRKSRKNEYFIYKFFTEKIKDSDI
jgi:hypothetical protein